LVSFGAILLLGSVAGATILLGMPVGRLRSASIGLRVILSAGAVGVLLFLVWDVLSAAWEPIDALLADGSNPPLLFLDGLLFAAGIAVGLLSIPLFMQIARGSKDTAEIPPRRLAVLIAVGIGLHNMAEGLAIGQSAVTGQIALATVLVVGFALHNATEGFGIVAPLAGDEHRPSWGFLLLLALIAGGPTILGTIIGSIFVSEQLSMLFLSLAAGSIIYVIIQLLGLVARARRGHLVGYGVFAGLMAGFLTDGILVAAGA
jgi:ZIP family zinc transporter